MCRQFNVCGRVQGVFFRARTREVATRLEIAGSATNMPDGSVDVLACGDAGATDQLFDWLHRGPPMASVASVKEIDCRCINPDRFLIG